MQKTINKILLNIWDPIGVAMEPLAQDEYLSYAADMEKLLKSNCSKDDLIKYLVSVEVESMALQPNLEAIHKSVEAIWTDRLNS